MSPARDESWILPFDSPSATLDRVGGKGASLSRLARSGLPVPSGFHVTTDAYRQFVTENNLAEAILSTALTADVENSATLEVASAAIRALFANGSIPADIAIAIRRAYCELGSDEPAVAVRSSATAEDLPEMSFAGQQDTFLNVRRADAVLEAVKRCWASLWTPRAIGYRARLRIPPADVALAVVVQRLVPAEAAGVLFTANPLTGERAEMMINAAWGLGEAVVSGHVTPDELIVEKQTGVIRSQTVADKTIMTVRNGEGTRDEPVPSEQRNQPVLTPEHAAELASLGRSIETLFGSPMDVEWAIHQGVTAILQARPITALPTPRVSLEWHLPNPKGRYARSSVIELLPDPLSPLFATLAAPQWNEAYRSLARTMNMEQFFPQEFLITINDYAYYDSTSFGGWKLVLAIPRLLRTAFPWLRRAKVRWADEERPRYAAVVAKWASTDVRTTPATELLDGAREICRAAAFHYLTIQSGILPVAYMSETLFATWYNWLLKRRNDPASLTFLLGFDSSPILAEKSLYDLAEWAKEQVALRSFLAATPSSVLTAVLRENTSPISETEAWFAFRQRLHEHLARFGHAVYDLDFAKALPSDDPTPLLDTLKHALSGSVRNPYERQRQAAESREAAMRALFARRNGLRIRVVRRLLRWAQQYAPLREDALADVGLGWPALRRNVLELGQRLVDRGALAESAEVFCLRLEELNDAARALDSHQPVQNHQQEVAERRARLDREQRATPPVALPIETGARFLGVDLSRLMPARTNQAEGNIIRGIGGSPGRVSGVARVIRGAGEFDQMRRGDILVTKITTPAWTPLFSLAAGIVTDVGGPLSHSSIVAREYQIPAVLGTGVATERIRSEQQITVDGDLGQVTIEK